MSAPEPMRQKVLVIEDNPVNLELVVALLEAEGYQVLTAGSADEGMQGAILARPDLILMDVQLPGRTGYEATRQLKSHPATATIPVVALTAQAMKGDREKAMEAGCDDYCAKPLDTQAFRTILHRFLRKQAE